MWSVIAVASACGGGNKSTTAPAERPEVANTAPPVSAAPTLPADIRALAPGDPLPKLGSGEVLLLAAKPGGVVVLKAADGKQHEVREGAVGAGADGTIGAAKLAFDEPDRAEVVESSGDAPHTAHVVTRAHDSGDFPHQEVWFVPTVGKRVQLAADATTIDVFWGSPKAAVVILNETASVVDAESGAATKLAESAGSPSYSPDGTLHYRTLDGGAWKWTGAKSEKVGKGKPGKQAKGDLNEGFEPAVYPPAVTFDKAGKPKFK
jgi:hypothetical protein